VLPSVESFQLRHKNPKVYFVFYEYIFKPVMGETRWKKHLEEDKRQGSSIAEAFAHALLENNYFAWLFEYKNLKLHTTTNANEDNEPPLKTEYEIRARDPDSTKEIFCGELEGVVEILVPETEGEEFKILSPTDAEAFENAKAKTEEINRETLREATSATGHKRSYKLVDETVRAFGNEITNSTAEQKKKKRKCMNGLKIYTGSALKTLNPDRKPKGWSKEGTKFIQDMTKVILHDVENKSHEQWERVYKKIIKNLDKSKPNEEPMEEFELDCATLYAEV